MPATAGAKKSAEPKPFLPALRTLADLGIDCQGLNREDQERIAEIGFDAWLDECALVTPKVEKGKKVKAGKKPRLCASGQKCMKLKFRKPAPAKGRGQHCSPACAASDRARQKRELALLPSAPASP